METIICNACKAIDTRRCNGDNAVCVECGTPDDFTYESPAMTWEWLSEHGAYLASFEGLTGTPKRKHCINRKDHFSGFVVNDFVAALGMIDFYSPHHERWKRETSKEQKQRQRQRIKQEWKVLGQKPMMHPKKVRKFCPRILGDPR